MRLALFGLDDTLLDGDCSDRWNLWMIEQGWISDAECFMARAEPPQTWRGYEEEGAYLWKTSLIGG